MKMHNTITDNCKKIRLEYQLATVRFDYMKASKAAVTTKTQCLFGNSFKNISYYTAFLISITLLNAYLLVKTAF